MHAIGIIAEYNPFHNGHYRQLQLLKKHYPDRPILVFLSGAFVQRGEPALFSKYHRARWALLGGADMVIELPTIFAISSASRFAFGAVALGKALQISSLSFGAETPDLSSLEQAAHILEEVSHSDSFLLALRSGLSYGTALSKMAVAAEPTIAPLLQEPNSLLAIEYIREIHAQQASITPLPLQRTGSHHQPDVSKTSPSGTALRTAIRHQQQWKDYSFAFPPILQEEVRQVLEEGAFVSYDRYYDSVLFASRFFSASSLSSFVGFSEGLEQRWKKASEAPSFPLFLEKLKSSRYSYARLQRMAAALVLQVHKKTAHQAYQQGPLYVRILGLSHKGRAYLRHLSCSLPIITKVTKTPLSPEAQQMLNLDIQGSHIQSLYMSSPTARKGNLDFYTSPCILK